jgi:hypothetical protein
LNAYTVATMLAIISAFKKFSIVPSTAAARYVALALDQSRQKAP